MTVVLPTFSDHLLSSVIKLEGKLLALQKANKASQATKAYASPVGSVKPDLVLGHTVSSMYDDSQTRNSQMCSRSTDCPDIVSAEDDDMRENESESSSDDE